MRFAASACWILACAVLASLEQTKAIIDAKIDATHAIPSLARRQGTTSDDQALRWDKNNYFLGSRAFVPYSSEFHPWRLPVPGLWRDVLEKLKSQGHTTVSIYTHWALIMPSPNPASVSLESPANDLKQFLTIAKELDILVILRPGPYINAETTGGGLPGWVQNLDTTLRVNTTVFNNAWKPYMSAILDAARPFQLKPDGNGGVDAAGGTLLAIQVENEFFENNQTRPYFDEIIRFYRQEGITVPTTFNDAQGYGYFRDDKNLDLWGRDSYPQGFNCSRPTRFMPLQNYTALTTYNTPASIYEFQGGSFASWSSGGYEQCAELTNSSFVRLFEKGAFADGVKLLSKYMGFGGTNWGNLAYSDNADTSYDYGAGVSEMRIKREKGGEMNLVGSFLKSFPSFAAAKVIRQGKNQGVSQQSAAIFVSELGNGNSSWYFVRQNTSSTSSPATFKLDIGGRTIPAEGTMTVSGRDSIIVPKEVPLSASGGTLLYSTSDVSFYGVHDDRDVIFLHGQADVSFELAIQVPGMTTARLVGGNSLDVKIKSSDSSNKQSVTIQWTSRESTQHTVLIKTDSEKQILLRFADPYYARKLHFPSLAAAGSLDALTGQGTRAIVHGPYHVASAKVSGSTLALRGQLDGDSTTEVFAPGHFSEVTFQGVKPAKAATQTAFGSILATFAGPSSEIKGYEAPSLTSWKMHDSLPEISNEFQYDSNWRLANLTSTPNAYFSLATTEQVLFSDAYGFHSNGMVQFRGHFTVADESSLPSSVRIVTQGGSFFASSTYINGKLVGTSSVQLMPNATGIFAVSDAVVKGNNTVLVLLDSMGLHEVGLQYDVPGYKYPLQQLKEARGIMIFDLLSKDERKMKTSVTWHVTGNEGGETLLDKVRGPLNEGGFYAERQGWHLPGYDDTMWKKGSPTEDGVPAGGVRFFRTQVKIDIPKDHDVPFALVFGGPARDQTQNWRSLVFVNGWQFGKRIPNLGPQTKFPIPPGILDPHGSNDVGILLWSLDHAQPARIPSLYLEKQGVFLGAPDCEVNNPSFSQVRGRSHQNSR